MEGKQERTFTVKGPRENHALWVRLFSNNINPKNGDFEETEVADEFLQSRISITEGSDRKVRNEKTGEKGWDRNINNRIVCRDERMENWEKLEFY